MENKEYWLQRAEKILLKTEKNTEKSLKEIIKLYKDTEKVIDNEIKKVYNKYAIDGKLTNKEAKALLNTKESKEIYDNLLIEISKIKNADYKRTLLSKYNAPAYSYRISRWEALKQDIALKIKQLADKEFEISKNNYIDTIENTYFEYNSLINEMQVTGLTSFTTINKNVLNRILETNWLGSNFSKRIWGNSILLENNLNNILKTGLAAGLSYAKMSQQLQETMNTSLFNSTRLIRTETNHFHNEAEYQSYIDDGVTEYEYAAVLDSRTSEICRNLDGKIFKVTEKRTGVNYPPMHPFCRSTTLPVIESIEVIEENDLKKTVNNDKININNLFDKLGINIKEYVPFGKYDPYDNDIQEQTAELLNMVNLPKIISKSEYQKYEGQEIIRVIHNHYGKTAQEAYDSTLYGKIQYSEYTNSSFGRGIYFGDKKIQDRIILDYAKQDNKIIEAKIDSKAKILEFQNQLEYTKDLNARISKVPKELWGFYKKEKSLLYMLDGYDGINLKWNNYYCIYNRGVLIVSE